MNKKLQIEWFNPQELKPNPWNTNVMDDEHRERLANSYDRFGLFKPILVRDTPTGEKEIVGGEHRNQIAVEKGETSVPIINLGTISDERAKEIGLVDNGRYGSDDPYKLSELLSEFDADDLTFLPFSDIELESIVNTDSIDLDDIDLSDDEDEPQLSPQHKPKTHQIMRFKIPIDDADDVVKIIDEVMSQQGYSDADSLTNAGDALVYILKGLPKNDMD